MSRGRVDEYMCAHRSDDNIKELECYFESVIEWVSKTFISVEPEMKGLEWGRLYEEYHSKPFDSQAVNEMVQRLLSDPFVRGRKGVFEYVLGNCSNPRLLELRLFDDAVKRQVYQIQSAEAKEQGVSNCPICATGHQAGKAKMWKLSEMDADHVTAWSRGGATDISNCQMLCSSHNRAKGNK